MPKNLGKKFSKPESKENNFHANKSARIWKNIHRQHQFEESHPEVEQSPKQDEQNLYIEFEVNRDRLIFVKSIQNMM